MQYSKLIETIWLIATREAIAASWKEIQPGHFLMGILKFAEIPQSDIISQLKGDKNTLLEITTELDQMQQFFKAEKINTTLLRRELRLNLGNGNEVYSGEVMHRSERCKQLFAETEKSCNKEGKSMISLIDVFTAFAKELRPDLFEKKNASVKFPKELNQLTIPFDSKEAQHYVKFPMETLPTNHPVVISLSKRITQQSKGILLFYKELDFFYLQLAMVAEDLRIKSQINIHHVIRERILTEIECLELLESYTSLDNSFLIFPAIDNDNEKLFQIQALNRFLNNTNVPSKILLPVSNKLQQWWYTQCPKSKLFLSPMFCNDASFFANLSIDKI